MKTRKPILRNISVCKQNRITNLGLSLLLGAGKEDLGFCRPEALGDCIERGDKLLLICGLFLPVPAPPCKAAGDLELTTGLCMIGVSPFSSGVGAVKMKSVSERMQHTTDTPVNNCSIDLAILGKFE